MSAPSQFSLSSPTHETTQHVGEVMGETVAEGDIICLHGDLGAGKTTLTQGLARGLGCISRVTSPTFTLVHEHFGRLHLYHLDCYRLDGPDDLEPLGAEDWIGRDGVCVIEWPERVLAALPPDRLDVWISVVESCRAIELRAAGPRSQRLLQSVGGKLISGLQKESCR